MEGAWKGEERGEWMAEEDLNSVQAVSSISNYVYAKCEINTSCVGVAISRTVAFRDLKGREFQWQNNAPGLHLQVYFLSPFSSSANIITLLPI